MPTAPYGGMSAGPLAAGNLFVCDYNGQQHFSYLDSAGNIPDAWYDGVTSSWKLQQINDGGMTAGPPAASNLFVCVYNNQQHFAYLDSGGNINDCWYDNSGWHLQKLNNGGMTNGPSAAHSLFVCDYTNQQHFAYIDSSGNVQDAWYNGSWHQQKINNGGMTSGPPAASNLFVCTFNDQQHFAYLDSSGNVQDSWYNGSWHQQKINNGGMTAGPPAASSLFVCVFNDQQHFSYLDSSGNVQDCWYDGATSRWNLQKLNGSGLTSGPAAAGNLFVCTYNDQQHFAYIDFNGNLQDAWYDGATSRWNLQRINNAGMTAAPPAKDSLFVCVFNNQQHFSYRDANGIIWDCWYGSNGWHLQQINYGVTWVPLARTPGGYASAMWLMGDGAILVNIYQSTQLTALRPDSTGSYGNGSWTPAGNLLLQKWAFSSVVLSDGRLVTCGGEYSGSGLPETETNFCEIYDPLTQISTQFTPPSGWTNIGDGPTAVLPSGEMIIGNTQGLGQQVAILNPSNLSWTFGVGDSDNEQGYTLMQNGDVLTTGVYQPLSKRYDRRANAFVLDASLPVMLGANSETGPGLSLMDGRVVWFGASGHTCLYTPGPQGQNGTWAQGPDLPTMPNGDQLAAADVSAILEPNGIVLLVVSGSKTPTSMVEYDPETNQFSMVANVPNLGGDESCRTLLLPNGHGLVSTSNGTWYEVQFRSRSKASWAPVITSFPGSAQRGATVTLSGTQLCGLSEVQSYGDDNQQAEHYPTVRFIASNGAVTYARAHGVSTRSIAPNQAGTVSVDIPANLAPGGYFVQLVAMGIPSASRPVNVT
jgi:hypothetical protein